MRTTRKALRFSIASKESIKANHSILSIPSIFSFLPSLFSLFVYAASAAEITLDVKPNRSSIYLGESFNLNIEVNGADRDLGDPAFPSLPPSDLHQLGQHSNSRSSISIINGRMTRESFEGRVFAYQIKPRDQGVFQTGPVKITFKGKAYTHPGVSVKVAGIEKQDTVIASVTASSSSVLVEEPFSITLSVAVSELPDPFAEHNEPIHPNLPPHISADFLEIREEPPGLKGPDLNQILNGLIDQNGRQPAFAINNYQTRDFGGFGSLFDSDPFRARPIRFRIKPERKTIDGKKYRVYSIKLDYTSGKEGEFTFGPLTFKGQVVTDVDANRQAITKDIYAIGPAATVRVVPPPDAGRPDNFIGSVGKNMRAQSYFDTNVCKVGDPLTLTLEVTGAISLSNMRTPLLSLQNDLIKDFRIYDDNVAAETLPDGKRFKYRVRPTREGTLEFPPVKLAYYDTEAGAYTTVATPAIPLQALPTTQIATAEEKDSGDWAGTLDSGSAPLPHAITLSPLALRDHSLLPPSRFALPLLLAGPLAALLAALVSPLSLLSRRLRDRRRHSGALRRARAALRDAHDHVQAARAARAYLADRLDVTGAALTPPEADRLLRERGVPTASAESCRALLAQLDEAMYRPGANANAAETARALTPLLTEIDRAFDNPARKAEVTDDN
ncbi:MAG: BatD family protein [Kiritimatiellae bacterium]|nr:BatD family protein [Kiritimatiellia bacterium]